MQYIVTGLDGRDQDAAQRRLDARQAHLASAEAMKANGSLLFASAILSEQEAMICSIMIVDFADRAALSALSTRLPASHIPSGGSLDGT